VTSRRRSTAAITLALLAAVAAVPLLATVDARLDMLLDAWRTCSGDTLATLVSDLVGPIGVAVLVAVALRALWSRRLGPVDVVRTLAALGIGVILMGELKEFLRRPRPGAELLGPDGASFPSGHVANTVLVGIAVLALWYGGTPKRRGWVLLAVVTTTVAAARVYGRRHWASDAIGATAIAVGYGGLAILHPNRRWRTVVAAAALLVLGAVHAASRHGVTIAIPAGTLASRRAPVAQIDFDSAYRAGLLRGSWSLDGADPEHHGVWLLAPTGEVGLGQVGADVSELRFVLRPRIDGKGGACCRLRVTLNDRVLGERPLYPGWRSYLFSTTASDFRPDGNVVVVEVRGERSEPGGAGQRRAVFRQLSLHAATEPTVALHGRRTLALGTTSDQRPGWSVRQSSRKTASGLATGRARGSAVPASEVVESHRVFFRIARKTT
jgi:membrane-associated phospholipid phosphatase